ncbi:iron-containing alcohol dehydrogenase [Streptomyces olivochromogenes]|uniref:iron-containing alcohol dehydrogenase n=1 Tax=Streptomyces olivochromogenes TaxID=1963 RepID=UPI0036DEF5DE
MGRQREAKACRPAPVSHATAPAAVGRTRDNRPVGPAIRARPAPERPQTRRPPRLGNHRRPREDHRPRRVRRPTRRAVRPLLLSALPAATAVPSAFDALAHPAEALYAPDRTPVTDLLAAEGIRALATALPGLSQQDPEATAEALRSLARSTSAPAALQDLGLRSADLDRAAELTVAGHLPGPAPVSAASVRALLQRAWSGAPPGPYEPRQQVQQVQGRCSGG